MTSQPSENLARRPPSMTVGARLGIFAVYATAVFVCALWTFGPGGIVLGLAIPLAWAYILWRRRRKIALAQVALIVFLCGGCMCLLPAVQQSRAAADITHCRNNLKQIGLALHNYNDVHGSFPPAHTLSSDGRPLLSWRVLLLLYLDEGERYKSFHLDEPWDSPHNLKLLKPVPQAFACLTTRYDPDPHDDCTTYVAVVGDRTLWPPDGRTVSFADIKDGTSDTAAVIELHRHITWSAPQDVSLDDALEAITAANPFSSGSHRKQDFFYDYTYLRHVLAVDGSVERMGHGIDRSVWLSLLQIDDGAPDPDIDLEALGFTTVKRARLGNWLRFSVLMILTLAPLPLVWKNPDSGRLQAPPTARP